MRTLILALATAAASAAWAQPALTLTSPGGENTITFQQSSTDGKLKLTYSVQHRGNAVIEPSRAGLHVDNRTWECALAKKVQQPDCWMDNMELDSVTTHPTVDVTWTPLYGERSTVADRYNSATLHLSKKDGSKYRLDVEVRAYDEGVAFRYFFPEHPDAIFHNVTQDLTEYTLPTGTMLWAEEWAQAPFQHITVAQVQHPVERALTLELPGGQWAALMDADVDDWCLTKFMRHDTKPNTLTSVMYSPVDIVTYYATPWKIIMTADTPGQLIERNDIVNNLNPPCAIPDADQWVVPGTIMRCTTMTTEAGLECVDFCAAHNIPYMLYDWLWYLPCCSHDGDATQVVDNINMQRVCDYARSKGVGVWLYVNQHALQKQARELFPLLKEWGVVGVKSGFVQYASHRWAVWLHDLVRLAADNQLMMNIHDEFRPSGFSRTYPNLLTQEGIRGNEEWPSATHNVTLPFARGLNGAGDYTICYYDKRLKNTHAHQLAASLVMYSPLQTILWYDKPSYYGGEPEIDWFEQLATVFDDTRVIDGYPGVGITMARRKGDTWYVAAMTNDDGDPDKTVALDFLDKGKKYTAVVYTDDPQVQTKTHVRREEQTVTSKTVLKLPLAPKGGAAIRITPITK